MKQQLVFLRRAEQAEQAQPLQRSHPAETLTLRLQVQQRLRLQQQLQQVYSSTSTHLLLLKVTRVTLRRPSQGHSRLFRIAKPELSGYSEESFQQRDAAEAAVT